MSCLSEHLGSINDGGLDSGHKQSTEGGVMESVNVNQCLRYGKVLNVVIMQTIHSAVAESMERRINDLRDLYATPQSQRTQGMAAQLASLERFARANVAMTNVPRDEWGPEWYYIEGCLEAMPDNAEFKEAALDYVRKRLERLAYD